MSFKFNGTTAFLEAQDPIVLPAQFTISAWSLIEVPVLGDDDLFGVYIPGSTPDSGACVILNPSFSRGTYDGLPDTGSIPTVLTWRHFAVVVDTVTTNRVTFFEDGVALPGVAFGGGNTAYLNMTQLLIGKGSEAASPEFYTGFAAETSVFATNLSPAQVASLFGGTNPVDLGPTLLFYSDLRSTAFDQISGKALLNTDATVDLLEHPPVNQSPSFSLSRFPTQVVVLPGAEFTPLPDPLVLDLFQAQWAQPVRVISAWLTDVTQSSALVAEERRSLVDRPSREQQVALYGLDQDVATRLLMFLSRLATDRLNVPFYPEVLVLTSAVAPGATELPVYDDAGLRRLYPGSRIVIMDPDDVVEYALIDQVFKDRVTLQDPLTNGFPINCVWLPVIDAEITLTQSTRPLTDQKIASTVAFSEVIGPSALPAIVEPGVTAGFYPVHSDGRLIFSGPVERAVPVTVQVLRAGEQFNRGRGDVVLVRGDRPQYQFSFTARCLSRLEAWGVLTLFDSVRGRTGLWWLPNPLTMFEPVSLVSSTVIRVSTVGNIDDLQEFLTHVSAFVGTAWSVHEIVSISDIGGGVLEITVTEPFTTLDVDEIEFFTSAHLVRFTNDSLEETWLTDGIVEISILAREVLEEAAVAITNLEDVLFFGGDLLQVAGLAFWYEANAGVRTNPQGSSQPLPIGSDPGVLGDRFSSWNRMPNSPPPGGIGDTGKILRFWAPLNAPPPGPATGTYVAPSSAFALNNSNGVEVVDLIPPVSDSFFFTDSALQDKFYGGATQTGFTFFCVFHDLATNTPGANSVCFMRCPDKFEFYYDEVKLFDVFGVDNPNNNVTYTDILAAKDEGKIFVCRWDPGVQTAVWLNGVFRGAAAVPIASIPVTQSGASIAVELRPVDGRITLLTLLNVARALPDSELDEVARALGSKYNIQWTDIA